MKSIVLPEGGMDLDKALKIYKEKLKHKRVFYVIQANLDKEAVTKFGIAGMTSGNPYSRLNEYVLMYGKYDKDNDCLGVKIFFLGYTEYNRLVEVPNSKVFKLELKLKRDEFLKTTTEHVGRGLERTSRSPKEVIKLLNQYEKNIEDVETVITRAAREKTKAYRDDRKAFIDSKTTDTPRRSARLAKNVLPD